MLCRTASDLYWLSRHIERAENTARFIDFTQRIALLPARLDPLQSSDTSLSVDDVVVMIFATPCELPFGVTR